MSRVNSSRPTATLPLSVHLGNVQENNPRNSNLLSRPCVLYSFLLLESGRFDTMYASPQNWEICGIWKLFLKICSTRNSFCFSRDHRVLASASDTCGLRSYHFYLQSKHNTYSTKYTHTHTERERERGFNAAAPKTCLPVVHSSNLMTIVQSVNEIGKTKFI